MKRIVTLIISVILLSTSVFATTNEHIKETVTTIVNDMYGDSTSVYALKGLCITLNNVNCIVDNDILCVGLYETYCTFGGCGGTVYIFNGILDLTDDEADELLMFYLPPTLCMLESIITDESYGTIFEFRMKNVREHENEELYLSMLSSTFQKVVEKMLEKMRKYNMQANGINSDIFYWPGKEGY